MLKYLFLSLFLSFSVLGQTNTLKVETNQLSAAVQTIISLNDAKVSKEVILKYIEVKNIKLTALELIVLKEKAVSDEIVLAIIEKSNVAELNNKKIEYRESYEYFYQTAIVPRNRYFLLKKTEPYSSLIIRPIIRNR